VFVLNELILLYSHVHLNKQIYKHKYSYKPMLFQNRNKNPIYG